MSQHAHTQEPSPERMFETLFGFQGSQALKAAIQLDLFTAIGEGADTVEALADRLSASVKGVRVLSDYLVIKGFLTKVEGRYGLTLDSQVFLNRRSPAYAGSAAGFLTHPSLIEHFNDLAGAVRKGGTVSSGAGTVEPDNPIWVEFARAMGPLTGMAAEGMASLVGAGTGKKWKVLDVAAGHGVFGIAIAKQNPNAHIVALDWEGVLEVAKENAQQAGVADRYSFIPGSAFEVELGSSYDVVLITNFLHHFDTATNEQFLAKVHAALADGGRVVTLESVPNDDRVTPAAAAAFSLVMLATTPGGDAYTFAEFDRMFRNAGFSASELHQLPRTIQQVIVSQK